MRSVDFITEATVRLVERGDRLHFHADEYHRDDWTGPKDFDVTVKGTFLNSIHGPRIFTEEKIGPEEVDDFYLADDWVVTPIKKENENGD